MTATIVEYGRFVEIQERRARVLAEFKTPGGDHREGFVGSPTGAAGRNDTAAKLSDLRVEGDHDRIEDA